MTGGGHRRRDLAVAIGTIVLAALLLVALPGPALPPRLGASAPPLRVCADPNNLPFSNRRQEGFETRLAAMLAADLHRPLRYVWLPERRGYIRRTLDAGLCDQRAGQKRAECQRYAKEFRRGVCRSQRNRHNRQNKQLARTGMGDAR